MINYDDMSDFQINKAVFEIERGSELGIKWIDKNDQGDSVCIINGMNQKEFIDYCNSPSDMWPIIVENMIDMIIVKPVCSAYDDVNMQNMPGSIDAYHANPLRAAAIVYLEMEEEK